MEEIRLTEHSRQIIKAMVWAVAWPKIQDCNVNELFGIDYTFLNHDMERIVASYISHLMDGDMSDEVKYDLVNAYVQRCVKELRCNRIKELLEHCAKELDDLEEYD